MVQDSKSGIEWEEQPWCETMGLRPSTHGVLRLESCLLCKTRGDGAVHAVCGSHGRSITHLRVVVKTH